jgi:formylglycine-generating enzyme required for sulfatase activity
MCGNVWEWCLDSGIQTVSHKSLESKGPHMACGGSWDYPAEDASIGHALWFPADSRNEILGFRVVCMTDRVKRT